MHSPITTVCTNVTSTLILRWESFAPFVFQQVCSCLHRPEVQVFSPGSLRVVLAVGGEASVGRPASQEASPVGRSRERRRGGAPRGRGETKTEIGDSKHHLRKFCFPKTGVPFSRLLIGSPISTEPSPLSAAHPSESRPARSPGEPRAASPAGPALSAEPWDTPPPRARLPRLDLPQLAGGPARRGGGGRVPRKTALPLVTTAAAARADPARRGSRWWWRLRRLRRRNGRRQPVS